MKLKLKGTEKQKKCMEKDENKMKDFEKTINNMQE